MSTIKYIHIETDGYIMVQINSNIQTKHPNLLAFLEDARMPTHYSKDGYIKGKNLASSLTFLYSLCFRITKQSMGENPSG